MCCHCSCKTGGASQLLASTSACGLSDDLGTNLCCGTHLVALGLLPQRNAGGLKTGNYSLSPPCFPLSSTTHTHTGIHISTTPLSVFRGPIWPAPASQSRQGSKSCWITIIEPKRVPCCKCFCICNIFKDQCLLLPLSQGRGGGHFCPAFPYGCTADL